MRFVREGDVIILVLDAGEDVLECILEAAKKEDVMSARVSGIGALGDVTLGYFDVDKKEYLKKTFPGSWELVALNGNLARDGGEPVAHVHVALGGPDYTVRAGHLFGGRVTVTCEIFLLPLKTKVDRRLDDNFGLKLIDF